MEVMISRGGDCKGGGGYLFQVVVLGRPQPKGKCCPGNIFFCLCEDTGLVERGTFTTLGHMFDIAMLRFSSCLTLSHSFQIGKQRKDVKPPSGSIPMHTQSTRAAHENHI